MVESHGGARKYQDLSSGTHSLEQREEEQRDSSAIMLKQDWGKELQLYFSNLLIEARKGGKGAKDVSFLNGKLLSPPHNKSVVVWVVH